MTTPKDFERFATDVTYFQAFKLTAQDKPIAPTIGSLLAVVMIPNTLIGKPHTVNYLVRLVSFRTARYYEKVRIRAVPTNSDDQHDDPEAVFNAAGEAALLLTEGREYRISLELCDHLTTEETILEDLRRLAAGRFYVLPNSSYNCPITNNEGKTIAWIRISPDSADTCRFQLWIFGITNIEVTLMQEQLVVQSWYVTESDDNVAFAGIGEGDYELSYKLNSN